MPPHSSTHQSTIPVTNRVLIVGAGFSGAVLARQLADTAAIPSLVIDERDHLGGNCHTERDQASGVMIHRYGPHIFHTSRTDVWSYVQRFGTFMPFVNRVKASIERGIFSLPINLHTINQFFGTRLNPAEAKAFLETQADTSITHPANFEEQALRFIGRDLYEAFFKGYTLKQWGCDPRDLPASILRRLPVRFNYDDNYYSSTFQGIPEHGYTAIVTNILDHPLIETKTSTPFEMAMRGEFAHVFHTGPIDQFYGRQFGDLGYRTVFWQRHDSTGDHQGNAVINYPGIENEFTRVHEHKHFAPWEHHERTVAFVEYSKETAAGDIPYYPKRLAEDMQVLDRYTKLASSDHGISFLGRLATYRYMDMHQVIGEALDFSDAWLAARAAAAALPVFPAATPL